MRSSRFILALGLCVGCLSPSSARAVGNADFITRLWQMEDGLPHNNVEAVAQTRDGYLWAGTSAGLARFDGVRFVVFDTNNAPALGNSYIRALCLRHDGSLWIGTAAGTLSRLQDGKFFALDTGGPAPGNILCLYESRDGVMWAGTETGLLRYANGIWSRLTTDDGLLHNTVRSITDYRGRVCVATDLGGNWFEDDRFIEMNPPGSGPAQYLRALWPDRAGNLWMGFRYGLGRLNPQGEFTRYTRQDGLPDENENVLFEDRQTNLWIGAMGGLNRLRDGNFSAEHQADGSSYGRVRCVFEDREGNVWVGTRDGLNQLRPRRFRTYSAVDGLAHNNVMSVLEDRNGTIWCAMWGGGLASLRGDTITNFSKVDPPPNALTTDNLLSLHEEPDGSLLVGVDYEGGIFRFQDGKFTKPIPAVAELTDEATRVIFRDHQGRLWLGLHSGLVLWDTREKWLHGTVVRAIVEDRAKNLWVGTTNGLYHRKGDGFEHFTADSGLSQNRVSSLRLGDSGELWIGTEGGGLNRFKNGRFTAYTIRDGLFSNQIGDILEDDAGWLWLSSVKGIFCVRKSDFDLLEDGKIESLRCIAYGKADGLATVQCNDFAKPAAWKGHDGRLWFATIKGLAVINPHAAGNVDSKPPPVLIEEMVVDGRAVYGPVTGGFESGVVRVPPGRGDLGIRYTGLSLQVPERVRFKYKLEGRDNDWVDAGDRRVVFFSNLQPGQYRFLVAARNNDGLWNEDGAAKLAFVLLPHHWQTWWFKLVIATLLALLGWAVYRFRAARYRQIERLRVRIAADLHDEIGSNVASIALLSKLGQRVSAPEADRRELTEISRIAEQTAHNIREIVWFINPDYDTLPEMIARMKDVAATMLGGLEHRFDAPDDPEPVRLSLEFRRDIFLMFKETLHNIVKHAQASRVDIQIKEIKGEFHLQIEDNGTGFDETKTGGGNGLKNLKLRMAQLGGEVEVRSAPGRGTTVSLSAKITRLHEGREIYLP